MQSTTDLLWSITLLFSSRYVSQNPCLCSLSYSILCHSFHSPLQNTTVIACLLNIRSSVLIPKPARIHFCFVLSSVTKLFDSTDNRFLLYLTQLEQGELASLLLSFKEDLRISHNQYSKKHSEPGGRAFCGEEINLCSVCKALLSPLFFFSIRRFVPLEATSCDYSKKNNLKSFSLTRKQRGFQRQ